MKQTAVEWLIELLAKEKIAIPDYIINKAKEIEKQQIIDAYKADLYPCSNEDAEQYYETFKSE